ncbi:MAG: ATP-dependent DNA ligase [Chlorobia bacterium]|nr:ATP-dependent DNA ligase [Fimbriimonadaceae bacterium]
MKRFAELYAAIDATNKTTEKVQAMVEYFKSAPPEDAVWTVALFTHRRPKRAVNSTRMQTWAAEMGGIPNWLFGECYDAVGDLGETISLVLGESSLGEPAPLHEWMEQRLPELARIPEEQQREKLTQYWRELDRAGRYALNKLIGGSFRVGVSQELVIRALSIASEVPAPTIAHRLMGDWRPTPAFFQALFDGDTQGSNISCPYPFCLAHSLESSLLQLGSIEDWHADWKWDGIRAQLVRRDGQTFVWSRGEELITERFPEVADIGTWLSDGTVLDGEVLAWQDDKPRKFLDLQKRIGRKTVGKKLLQEVPVQFVAFDILELDGVDVREEPLSMRRAKLTQVCDANIPNLRISPTVTAESWDDLAAIRETARDRNVEGLMLKRLDSPYLVGRKKGLWWKWKIDPLTVDAVLIYAARGSGKRASLYTDYTFGVWDGDKLVSFAKAYSGLSDEEIRKVDAWVRRNTLEKFGPVRTVTPELVFELAFEGIQLSTRHKSGIAVRFPRIARWRQDKPKEEADRLSDIKAMLLENGG